MKEEWGCGFLLPAPIPDKKPGSMVAAAILGLFFTFVTRGL
jgi:hypothetical protein